MTSTPTQRVPTSVDEIAERWLDAAAAHDPVLATTQGIAGHDHRLPDYDPSWYERGAALRRATLAELAAAEPTDLVDRVTVAALREQLETAEQVRANGDEDPDVKNMDSPTQTVRDAFDLMPTASADDWSVIAERLHAVPRAVAGYVESLRSGLAAGTVRPRRQVLACVEQGGRNVGPDGFFATFAAQATDVPADLRRHLADGAEAASAAYAGLLDVLRDELLPVAPERDAVGRERYAAFSRYFIGSVIDLDETYAWGQEELARLEAERVRTADRIRPGATPEEAAAILDADPSRRLEGTDALRAWMQEKSDTAVEELGRAHFDIPDAIRTLACRIAPTQNGGIYYTPPSEDLVTRPGTMWWSVPPGDTEFGTWRELTTVYHEGVPGHHLQIAQTAYRSDVLNRWLRIGSWLSGHGEGWALYAERLMDELGYLDDPGDRLGMLDSQAFRAARVVLDIGIHCELDAPDEVGGGAWDWDKAWTFLSDHGQMSEKVRHYELERYLGWPGQAPSYKVGERLWLNLREEVRAKEGDAFDLASFHRRALDVGSVSMDVVRAAVLGEL